MKKSAVILVFATLLAAGALFAQGVPINGTRRLIDMPTAGMLERASYSIDMRMFTDGGLLSSVAVGISDRFMLGMSYGGVNIIGQGTVDWNPEPGILARARLIDENYRMPAVVVGFESQGYGPYNTEFERYETKSRGVFLVASKNYAVMNNLGFHGGINYSLENKDNDKQLNVFIGADVTFNEEFHGFVEFDFANNDNKIGTRFGSGRGYLNAGLQWIFAEQLFLQFNVKNLMENGPNKVRREFRIGYFEYF